MAAQPNGAPCCPNLMGDACLTGLFCASFTVGASPTCQPDGSRSDMTECTDDVQCASGSCNVIMPPIGECRSRASQPCSPAIGCAPMSGKTPLCQGNPPTCVPIGNGSTGAVCAKSSDCVSDDCVMGKCLGARGQPCSKNTDCASGTCMACGFTNTHCSSSNDAMECLESCGVDSTGNTIFSPCVSLGGACNSFNDCQSPAQCSSCGGNNTCQTASDLNECLDPCPDGISFSFSC
jgi:hypothetical protein